MQNLKLKTFSIVSFLLYLPNKLKLLIGIQISLLLLISRTWILHKLPEFLTEKFWPYIKTILRLIFLRKKRSTLRCFFTKTVSSFNEQLHNYILHISCSIWIKLWYFCQLSNLFVSQQSGKIQRNDRRRKILERLGSNVKKIKTLKFKQTLSFDCRFKRKNLLDNYKKVTIQVVKSEIFFYILLTTTEIEFYSCNANCGTAIISCKIATRA